MVLKRFIWDDFCQKAEKIPLSLSVLKCIWAQSIQAGQSIQVVPHRGKLFCIKGSSPAIHDGLFLLSMLNLLNTSTQTFKTFSWNCLSCRWLKTDDDQRRSKDSFGEPVTYREGPWGWRLGSRPVQHPKEKYTENFNKPKLKRQIQGY